MRGIFGSFAGSAIARGALAVALATGVAAGSMTLGATAAVAKDKKEKAPKAGEYSAGFKTAAMPLQTTLTSLEPLQKAAKESTGEAKKAAQAQLKAAAAAAVPQVAAAEAAATTPQDKFTIGNWALSIGSAVGDSKMQQRGIQTMLDSGQIPAASLNDYKFFLGNLAYNNNDYATTVKVMPDVIAANYPDDIAAEQLAEAYNKMGQPQQGLAALQSAIAARKAANGTVPQDWYSRASSIAYNAKLGAEATSWSREAALAYPTAMNWLAAAQLTREASQFTNQESLDLGRFMARSGAFNADPKFTAREYVEYIEAASKTGISNEVATMAQAGLTAGVLQKSDPFVNDALREGTAAAAKDKAALANDEKTARTAPDGKRAASTGDSYLSFGDAAKAEELFKLAVEKGGIDKDRVMTRLGIAQLDQGKYADAKATFAQVGGMRTDLGKLFAALADAKAAGN